MGLAARPPLGAAPASPPRSPDHLKGFGGGLLVTLSAHVLAPAMCFVVPAAAQLAVADGWSAAEVLLQAPVDVLRYSAAMGWMALCVPSPSRRCRWLRRPPPPRGRYAKGMYVVPAGAVLGAFLAVPVNGFVARWGLERGPDEAVVPASPVMNPPAD